MNLLKLIKTPPLCLNQADAIEYLGSEKLFKDMLAAKWIAPVVYRPRFVLYDRASLDSAWARIRLGEYPIGKK